MSVSPFKVSLTCFKVLFIIAIGLPVGSIAQNFTFQNYQAENGLSQNTVFSIIQSNDGFMWFGTKAGLNRFDGYNFKLYSIQDANSNGLRNNFIKCLHEDKNGFIWTGTNGGLYRFNPKTGFFKLFESTKSAGILDIKEDNDNNIWFVSNQALHLIQKKTLNETVFNFSENEIPSSLLFLNNILYVGLKNGEIKAYNSEENRFTSLPNSIPSQDNKGTIVSMIGLNKQTLVFGTYKNGAFIYDLKTYKAKPLITKDQFGKDVLIRDLLINKNQLWIASESGLYIYDFTGKQVINLRKDLSTPNTISDNAIYALCKDKQAGIWAGTYFKGVDYCLPNSKKIKNFYPSEKTGYLKGSFVRELLSGDDKEIWIGTEDEGLFILNKESQLFSKVNLGNVTNIHGLADMGENMWVGSFSEGLFIVDKKTKRVIKHYTKIPDIEDGTRFVEKIYYLKSGRILVSTPRGVYSFDKNNETFSKSDKLFGVHHCKTILEAKNGDIWAGSLKEGLFRFCKNENRLYHYERISTPNLSSDYVNYIYEDSGQNIWICTENGLNLFKPKENLFESFNSSNGFPSSVFYTIIEIGKSEYWLSTSNGLSKFNYRSKKIENYGKNNGLTANQFNYSSVLYDKKQDRLYYGSINGITSLIPSSFKNSNFKLPVFLTSFRILRQNSNSKNILATDKDSIISYTKKIDLSYKEASFSIEFAALSFESSNLIQYAYRLKGASNEWIYLKNDRKVNFNSLEPGDYEFEVKAGFDKNEMKFHSDTLFIHLSPPFYLSDFAYFIYFIIVLTAIAIALKLYQNWLNVNQKVKMEAFEKQIQKEVYQSKIEFFTNITHEIKTPLTLIKSPLDELLKKSTGDEKTKQHLRLINKNTDRLLSLTKELLDFRNVEKQSFHLSFVKVHINKILKELYQRYKPYATSKNIQFILRNAEEPFIAYADKEALTKILSNLIDNAIKYCRKQVTISIQSFDDHNFFNIIISNDGDLIPKEFQSKLFEPFFRLEMHQSLAGSGLGLPLAHSLAKLHEGDLKVHTDQEMNIFVLNLPVHHDVEFVYDVDIPKNLADEEFNDDVPAELNTKSPHILIVDDNSDILSFLYTILSPEFKVSKALSVTEALTIQKEQNIQLIISDVMMPEINGFEFCSIIKEDIKTAHIPVILLTAKNSLQSKIEGIGIGADAYIEKPFSTEYLLTQIHTLINNREHIKSYYASTPAVHLKSIAFNKTDENFLSQINEIIHKNMTSGLLNVDFIAAELNMSRGTFYRKIKAVSNLSPNDLILVGKLKIAAQLLAENRYKIFEVANKTGFSSQAQFTRNFSKQFKCTPSEYVESLKEK